MAASRPASEGFVNALARHHAGLEAGFSGTRGNLLNPRQPQASGNPVHSMLFVDAEIFVLASRPLLNARSKLPPS